MEKPKEIHTRVHKNEWITDDVFQISLEPREGELDFIAGQFLSAVIPGAGPNGKDLRRAYSIASHPENKRIELCIKRVEGGRGSPYLASLQENQDLRVFAPYGKFVLKRNQAHVVFVATGTGLSPFRSIIHSTDFNQNPPQSTRCIFGVSYAKDILYASEFKANSKVEWIPCLSREENPGEIFKGRVSDRLRETDLDINWSQTEFYLCGNGAMIKEVKQMLLDQGVDKKDIHVEVYYQPK